MQLYTSEAYWDEAGVDLGKTKAEIESRKHGFAKRELTK